MSNIMNEYTTFHKVLDYLQYFQEQSPMLNTFGYGNLVDFGKNVSGSSVNYPFLFVVPQAIEYQENMTVYSVTMIFADILNWDLSNEKDCVSDMSWEAKRFLSYLKYGQNTLPTLYDNIDVNMPVQAIPFFERFGDHVAGVAMEVPLIVYDTLDACDYYPTPTPTASVTPTNTTTPTPTPIPFCLDIVSLTNNFGPSDTDGNYDYIGNGYVNFDTSASTYTLYSGIAPNSINYSLYKSGATNYVVATFIDNVLDILGPYNYWDGGTNLFGNIPSTISSGYVIPTNPSEDFTIDYPNCPLPTPTPTITPTVTPS
jgi:hypothetical protein